MSRTGPTPSSTPPPRIPDPDGPRRGVDPGQVPTPRVHPHPDSAPSHPTVDPSTGVPGSK